MKTAPGIPDQIGLHRVEAVLGSGGMGIVFRALDPSGRAVALKVPHLGAPPAVIARFHREATIRIDHPNVVGVLDSGMADDRPWIAFELLEGETLASRLRRTRIPIREIVAIFIQACQGLMAAHRVGVVHRDLKPDNIFCCSDGRVKVLDFGIARIASDFSLTAEGAVVGTLAYLAPEQARGEPLIDRRVDLWAMGAILYEALTGAPPFIRTTVVGTLMAILHDPLPSLAGVMSPGLASVVSRCLTRSRDDRIANATELLEALKSVAAEGSTELLTMEASAETELDVRGSLRPDELRVVVLLLARGVRDQSAVREVIEGTGGEYFSLLGQDAVGLFGGRRTEGDELGRALEAGLACRRAAERVAVGSGRAWREGETLSGGALEEAQAGCERDVAGVAVARAHLPSLSRFLFRSVDEQVAEVLAPRPASWTEARSDEPLLAREIEMVVLRDLAQRTIDEGVASVAVISGTAGMGKSRLCQWFVGMWEGMGHRAIVGEAAARDVDAAGALVAALLRQRAECGHVREGWPRADPAAPPDERVRALEALVRDAMPHHATVADHVRTLSELLAVGESRPIVDARWAADRLRLAFVEYLDAVSQQGPLLIVVDDAQWADPASREILAAVRARVADRPVLFLATERQVGEARWLGDGRALELRLRGLDVGATSALIARTAGDAPSLEVSESVRARTEGNPLFIQHLVLGGALGVAVGAELPATIEAAVQSRLDRLPEAEKGACKAAAIFGRAFSRDEVASPYREQLDELVREEVLRIHETGRFAFFSELTRDVAYRMIAPELRQRMHAEVAASLEHAPGATPSELALHFDAAGDGPRAALHHARAAVRVWSRGDAVSVLRHASRALELGLPESAVDIAFAFFLARTGAFNAIADRTEQEAALTLAGAAARTSEERLEVQVERVLLLAHVRRVEEALELSQQVLDGASDEEIASEPLIVARGRRGELLGRLGRYDEADVCLARAADDAIASPPHLRARVEEWTGLVASYRGDLGHAQRHFDRALRLYRLAGDPRRSAGMEANLADALNRLGEHEAASVALEEALAACRAVGYRAFEPYVLDNLGYALTELGRLDEALATLEHAEAIALETGVGLAELVARLYRARALTQIGRQAEAEALARSVADDARASGRPGYAALAWARAAQAALAADAVDRALDLSARALALRDELGGTPEDEACVFAARARALDAAGEEERARKVRSRGAMRLREVASAIADPRWRERFLEGPADHRQLLPR